MREREGRDGRFDELLFLSFPVSQLHLLKLQLYVKEATTNEKQQTTIT